MIYFLGIRLVKTQKIKYALVKIYGIGLRRTNLILNNLKINSNLRVMELSKKILIKIRQTIESQYLVEKLLKRTINLQLTRLNDIKCLRGRRHALKLPVRGQRTRTNARTKRGKKKTVAGKKK
jgi:small subunit ribosomal protein S13